MTTGEWLSQEADMHIKLTDIRAVFMALTTFQERIIGQARILMIYSTIVVAYANKQGWTLSRSLCMMTQEILEWVEIHAVEVSARSIPCRQNIVVDHLMPTNWWLLPQVPKEICWVLRRSMMDLYYVNIYKLPVYAFKVPGPMVWEEDAFQHPWDCLEIHLFHLFTLIWRVINLLPVSNGLIIILVALLWLHREWFSDLLSLLVEEPLQLQCSWISWFRFMFGNFIKAWMASHLDIVQRFIWKVEFSAKVAKATAKHVRVLSLCALGKVIYLLSLVLWERYQDHC